MTHRTIGEVAAVVGVSPQTLRVWEARGLLAPDHSAGGKRRYTDQHVQRALQIAELRRRHGWNPAAIRTALADPANQQARQRHWNNESIRRARRARDLTLKQLADLVGVSASHLGTIERGEAGISTQLIMRIADALLVRPTELATFPATDPIVVRADQRARGEFDGGVVWEELSPPGRQLEPALLIAPPGQDSGGPYSRPAETFVFVLAGPLHFTLPDNALIVANDGDSVTLPARTPFSWDNPGPRESRSLWVESPSPHPPSAG
jgi:DNA-binding transcriptional MerR regulator/quercetin dioxygenase-like cupin family protein